MMQPIRSGKTGSLPQSNPPGWRPLPINDSSRPSVEQSRNVVTGAALNTFDSKLSANALLLHRKQVEELKHFSLNNCFNSSVESSDRPAPRRAIMRHSVHETDGEFLMTANDTVAQQKKRELDRQLDEELEATFPASDPPKITRFSAPSRRVAERKRKNAPRPNVRARHLSIS